MYDSTRWDTRLAVTTNGSNVIAHAGAATLRLTADCAGLTKALSDTLRREDFAPDHDRGRVLVDAAVMMADGGNTLRAIDVLRHQSDLLGEVASPATLCRALGEIDAACLDDLDAARARVSSGRIRWVPRRGWWGGCRRVGCWMLNRPASGEDPGMRVEYSVGWPVDAYTCRAIAQLPAGDWTPMLAADGLPGTPAVLDSESGPDTVGEVAETTALLPHLQTWPDEHRVFVRRVKPLRDTTRHRGRLADHYGAELGGSRSKRAIDSQSPKRGTGSQLMSSLTSR